MGNRYFFDRVGFGNYVFGGITNVTDILFDNREILI